MVFSVFPVLDCLIFCSAKDMPGLDHFVLSFVSTDQSEHGEPEQAGVADAV